MEIDHPLLGKFQIIKLLGEGSFASVYLALNADLQYPVSIKIFQDKNEEKHIIETFNITKSIMHPFICQDFDIMKTGQGNSVLLMEYIQGITLLEYANSHSPLSENEIRIIFGQLVIAIDFLHKNQIIHRDLKCENIMIDSNKNIRLIDLSFSCQNINLHSTICGSPGYIAPEMINNDCYTDSIDIWSLGVIVYAITYGKLPFYHQNITILNRIIASIEPVYPTDRERISSNLVDLIKKMLIKDPKKRITINEIKEHSFFTTDSTGKKYNFNDQQINYFIRYPYSKMVPETQIIQQMKLSIKDSINAINEIKDGKKSTYSMTYNILYKNYISNTQLQYYARSFLYPIKEIKIKEVKSEVKCLPLMIDIKNITKSNDQSQTERLSDMSHIKLDTSNLQLAESPSSSRENFNNHITKQNGSSMYLNGNVQFRKFSSIGKSFATVGIKKNVLSLKNLSPVSIQMKNQNTFSNINNHKESNISLQSLPHLMTPKRK